MRQQLTEVPHRQPGPSVGQEIPRPGQEGHASRQPAQSPDLQQQRACGHLAHALLRIVHGLENLAAKVLAAPIQLHTRLEFSRVAELFHAQQRSDTAAARAPFHNCVHINQNEHEAKLERDRSVP